METLPLLDDKRELISLRTLAVMIDTKPKTLRDWVYKGYLNIPYIKMGSQLRFEPKEIRRWWGAMRLSQLVQAAKAGEESRKRAGRKS